MRILITSSLVLLVLAAAFYWPRLGAVSDSNAYSSEKTLAASSEPLGRVTPAMDIETAYQSIPHQRTPFQTGLALMPDADAAYLTALFRLTDIGVSERVAVQSRFYRGEAVTAAALNYPAILQSIKALETPDGLMPVERLIYEAIAEQRDYFAQWAQSGDSRYFDPRAPLIRSSHGKLINAYNLLIKRYGSEPAHNRQAFFDHLCALDFI